MLKVNELRKLTPSILCLGSHPGIVQSMLDFDYLNGRTAPSVRAIIAAGRKKERFFFGDQEILVPVYERIDQVPEATKEQINLVANLSSGRRVLTSTVAAIELLPNLVGAWVFAERLPELHALELRKAAEARKIWMVGGASVGVIVPGALKLGAIGGTQAAQLEASKLMTQGQIAVVSTSGGMVNEIIRQVADSGYGVSFAVALGGERYPMLTPKEAFLAAQRDPATKAITYFGELGGTDEFELAELLKSKQVTKPVVAYIAGVVAELFETPPQFGHAKAMAATSDESARSKRDLLNSAGARAAESFKQFIDYVRALSLEKLLAAEDLPKLSGQRRSGVLASSLSYDVDGDVRVLGQDMLDLANNHSFAYLTGSMLTGRLLSSKTTEEFIDFILRLLVDHGPYVSGAVNTIVTARAGRDLVSSLAAGLLTIGPRFGGAINDSAAIWLKGVTGGYEPAVLVEEYAARKQYIAGIGHRKYRADHPDPRVDALTHFTHQLPHRKFTNFARGVEKETLKKKGNLILNVDGAIAAGLLDVLSECEGYDTDALQSLVDAGFFNALFVLSRSVGFMAHYFDQVRLDEGLFRLNADQITRVQE